MNLAIDSGNSYTKLAFFEKGKLIKLDSYPNELFETTKIPPADYTIISSVSEIDFHYCEKQNNCILLNNSTELPVNISYETPETLGTDRIAAVVGAKQKFPEHSCLVVNAGTCITMDFIDREGTYIGGSISPGINLRFKALNSFTARLPLLGSREQTGLTGKSTKDAILSGVLNGVIHEVQGIINEYKEIYTDCTIILTGGDLNFFERNLKGSIFVLPELVLIGLNTILEYNVSKA